MDFSPELTRICHWDPVGLESMLRGAVFDCEREEVCCREGNCTSCTEGEGKRERKRERENVEPFFSLPGCMISSRWHYHNDASVVHQANQGEVVRSKLSELK